MNQSLDPERASGWHALHPFTRLTFALALIVAAFTVRWTYMPIALFVLVILPVAVRARIARAVLRGALLIVLPLAVSLLLVQGLYYPGADKVGLWLGPLALKAEGLEFAFITAARILVTAGSGLLVVYSTPPPDLALAMVQGGVPSWLAYVVVTAIQLVPAMQNRAAAIRNAQQARGLETEGNAGVRLRAFVPLIAPLIYSSLEGVQERALALEARAFRARRAKTSWRALPDSRAQLVARVTLLAGCVLLVLAALI